MPQRESSGRAVDDVDAVTRAVMTASRLLMGIAARSLAQVEEPVTLPQFRMLVVEPSAPAEDEREPHSLA
ncbi:hypothetical protein SY2F82_67710 [Streptomyces sp. Y2F8-2]|nr:hypothetical protein SY2F82_67710 [Streptomyces sp. Y2F8-2]